MKLAIMQPYFLPYLGYFQLINSVDKFIIFDDVTYINKGWINRNRILLNGKPWSFTVPLKNASQNILIKDLLVSDHIEKWVSIFIKTIERAYKKAPHFNEGFGWITKCLSVKSKFFIDWLIFSIEETARYFSLTTKFYRSSDDKSHVNLKGQDRILSICIKENADTYINPINGRDLYDKNVFSQNRISLFFLNSDYTYKQFESEFVKHLSIIDVIMFNDIEKSKQLLNSYNLI